ncbi:molybdopterin-dependent oxidoreductase [bacterium]|nr:molybdopterin-dependent oxidoreductase [bacterium]MBU1957854.1 molybdopterin-dependent oxidoreductase [bacterium]
MSEIKTTCGLDCPDACGIVSSNGNIKADTNHPTSNGALCALLNKYLPKEPRITSARVAGKEVSLEEAMNATKEALDTYAKLLWRGSGNFGVMQEITNLLFEKIEGTTTKGTLCDGAGDAGILEGREVNRVLPPEQIAKAEVVVVWGKNITVTASHLMPYLEGKEIIVIDPIKTAMAKKADIFCQIAPRSDFFMAIMLARFAHMGDFEDQEYLEEHAPDHEDFYAFTQEFRVRPILDYIGTDLNEMGQILEMIHGKKTVFLVGNGVQKYSTGHHVLQAIDALAVTLGKFGKEGCGVGFLANSKLNFKNPFTVKTTKVQKVDTPFGDFGTVLIQGGNPVASMPNSNRVIEELKKTNTIIYYGLYENETSAMADIVIPAKNFFEKEDVRLSYAHQYVAPMRKIEACDYGISEYDFTDILLQKFGFESLQSEEYYINLWLDQCEKHGDYYLSPAFQAIPYKDGFGNDGDEEFVFPDEFGDDFIKTKQFTRARKKSKKEIIIEDYWLISPKANKALNTQFQRDNKITLHPSLGFENGETINVYSEWGEHHFEIKNSEDMRADAVLITANTIGVNFLTPSIISEEGDSACYQEVKVKLKRI